MSARKPAPSFWRENRDTVVILVRGFAKMLWCQNESRARLQFSICKMAHLPGITEQPILQTKSMIRRPGYKFSKYFRQKRAVRSPTRYRSRPGI